MNNAMYVNHVQNNELRETHEMERNIFENILLPLSIIVV